MRLEKETLLYKAVLERLYEDAGTRRYRQEALDHLADTTDLAEIAELADVSLSEVTRKLRAILGE
jgi:hypothetical protein